MKHHGLRSTEGLPTDWTAAGPGIVVLVEVSVQSLGEGGFQVTEVTLPGLVVLVISVHVVHNTTESATLEATQLTDTELPAALRYFLLCNLAHHSCLGSRHFNSRPTSLFSLLGSAVIATYFKLQNKNSQSSILSLSHLRFLPLTLDLRWRQC